MEALLQYVWQHRLWTRGPLATQQGDAVEVIDPGVLNTDAGPDFFNAKVRIGQKMWAGNVEIHINASDWYRHNHDSDRAYDSVILHVVAHNDGEVRRPDGSIIPQIKLEWPENFRERYSTLVSRRQLEPACAQVLRDIPGIYISDWITSLALARLQRKADRIAELASAEGGDWQHAVYVTLARTLGFHTNSDAFERLALSMPLRRLRRHADQPLTVQGMLFGQAGFLDKTPDSPGDAEYVEMLRREYRFMASKFGLHAPESLGWKMSRMRPYHLPARTLASLAQFVCEGFKPGMGVLKVRTADQARELFDIDLTGYWERRFGFTEPTARTSKAFSRGSLDVLVINVAAPALYAYGQHYGNSEMTNAAVEILSGMAPEGNRKVRMFTDAGLPCPDAFTSQALIELETNYCEPRKCLYCRLGHRYLSKKDSCVEQNND